MLHHKYLLNRSHRAVTGLGTGKRPACIHRRDSKCRSSEDDRQFVSELPTSLIANQLKLLGQNCRYIFDKAELVDLLVQARAEARSKIVRLPLRRCESTPYSPKEYVLVPVDLGDEGFAVFALDSGASNALVTPALRDRLGVSPMDGTTVKGVMAEGVTLRQQLQLPPLCLGGQQLDISNGVVTELRSPNLKDVDGMLGMQFLRQFDIEMDFEQQQIAFYPPGCAAPGGLLDTAPLASITCMPIIGGLMTVLVSLNGAPRFPAVIDIGSSLSVINTPAALHAKLEEMTTAPYVSSVAASSDAAATPVFRPTKPLMVTIGDQDVGDGVLSTSSQGMLITDARAFATLGMSEQPAMLLAMDVLRQRKVVLSFSQNKMFLGL